MNPIELNFLLPPGSSYKEPKYPPQRWREECFADTGWSFLKTDGEDALWYLKLLPSCGTKITVVRIYPNGEWSVEPD
jgi:hypothetical protein